MSEHLQKLTRIVPGVAGYGDREHARETDHAIRLRVSAVLERAGQDVEAAKRACVTVRALGALPDLDRVSSTIERIAGTVRDVGRGSRAVFDVVRTDPTKLEQLYTFDLQMLETTEAITNAAGRLRGADATWRGAAAQAVQKALEAFEPAFAKRETLLAPR